MDDKSESDSLKPIPKLEELCFKFVGRNGQFWQADDLSGIPRHILLDIVEYLHPFDLERLDVAGVFEKSGICTNAIWGNLYAQLWQRKSKWPNVYFKSKGIPRNNEIWKVYFLQRYLQEAINSAGGRMAHVELGCFPCSNKRFPKRGGQSESHCETLQTVASVCGRYAAYLRIYNSACIFLAEHLDIFLTFADSVEFLEVFHLRDNSVDSLCCLLNILSSKGLKSVGFCFSKVYEVHLWNKILLSLTQRKRKTDNRICLVKSVTTQLNAEQCGQIHDFNTQPPFCQSKVTANPRLEVSSMEFSTDLSLPSKNSARLSHGDVHNDDSVDIYDFSTTSGWSKPVDNSEIHVSSANDMDNSDLYDEIFGVGEHSSLSVPQEHSISDGETSVDRFSGSCHQTLFNFVSSDTADLSTLGSPLIHFELTAFPFHQLEGIFDMLALRLKWWLNLESLTLDDDVLSAGADTSKLVDTLSHMCNEGKLQYLEIVGNSFGEKFARQVFKELVSVHCSKCTKFRKSLATLILSSNFNAAFAVTSLAEGISGICCCKENSSGKMMVPSSLVSGYNPNSKLHIRNSSEAQHCLLSCGNSTSSSLPPHNKNESSLEKQVLRSFDTSQMTTCNSRVTPEETCEVDLGKGFSLQPSSNKGFPVLCESGCRFIGIQELSLKCTIGNRGAMCIAQGLLKNATLQLLNLSYCSISVDGMEAIFESISDNTSLKILSLQGNYCQAGIGCSLAKMLESNKTLTDLDIGYCFWGAMSQKTVQALCMNNTLKCLRLEGNRSGDAGVTAVSQVFAHPSKMSSITKLDLSNNQASLKSLSVLASSLQHIRPRKLEELNLTGNFLDLATDTCNIITSLKDSVVNLTVEHVDHATLFADFISQM